MELPRDGLSDAPEPFPFWLFRPSTHGRLAALAFDVFFSFLYHRLNFYHHLAGLRFSPFFWSCLSRPPLGGFDHRHDGLWTGVALGHFGVRIPYHDKTQVVLGLGTPVPLPMLLGVLKRRIKMPKTDALIPTFPEPTQAGPIGLHPDASTADGTEVPGLDLHGTSKDWRKENRAIPRD